MLARNVFAEEDDLVRKHGEASDAVTTEDWASGQPVSELSGPEPVPTTGPP